MAHEETIYAPATAPGRAAIAIVRLSGPRARHALRALSGKTPPPPRRASVMQLYHPATKTKIDEALVLWFPAPDSYTGCDMVELHIHGGSAVMAALLDGLAACAGLRPAAAGGFTRQAVANGRMDLTRAEAIADVIDADSPAQLTQALAQKDGSLAKLYDGWRARLLAALASAEAQLEFGEDEALPAGLGQKAQAQAQRLAQEMKAHLAQGHAERLRQGLEVVLVGAPNVGKSSLLNRLARRKAAIVAAKAGTTRDVLEVALVLDGMPLRLIDTAGLRASRGVVEKEGVRRAMRRAEGADLRLFLVAAGQARPPPNFKRLWYKGDLLVYNKSDLSPTPPPEHIAISAKTGAGIPRLVRALAGELKSNFAPRPQPAFTRARHRVALRAAVAALGRASRAKPEELAAEDMRLAAQALGELTGRVDVERLLDKVFRDFCIGK